MMAVALHDPVKPAQEAQKVDWPPGTQAVPREHAKIPCFSTTLSTVHARVTASVYKHCRPELAKLGIQTMSTQNSQGSGGASEATPWVRTNVELLQVPGW